MGKGTVTGDGDVPDDRHVQEGLDTRIMRLRLKWVPEKGEKIDLTICSLGPDLLIPFQWSALEPSECSFSDNDGGWFLRLVIRSPMPESMADSETLLL
jgi:hypothetical protein